MVSIAKAFALMGLLCPLSLAADCNAAGSCVDETSLVQVKQIVKHGGERSAPAEEEQAESDDKQIPLAAGGVFNRGFGGGVASPGANAAVARRAERESARAVNFESEAAVEAAPLRPNRWPTRIVRDKAIAEAMPAGIDSGEVNSAFGNNMGKAKAKVVDKAADMLAFNDKVSKERMAIKSATTESLAHDKDVTRDAMKDDLEKVSETVQNRMRVKADAIERVRKAQEEAMAKGIKQQQAQQAAMIGRMMGAKEGEEESARADAEVEHNRQVENAKAALSAEEDAERKHQTMQRDAIDQETQANRDAMQVLRSSHQKETDAAQSRAAADTALWEENINGPEDLNNVLTDRETERVVGEYARLTGKETLVSDDLTAADENKAEQDDLSTVPTIREIDHERQVDEEE